MVKKSIMEKLMMSGGEREQVVSPKVYHPCLTTRLNKKR